jgi:photosystem II stability/assembly factor-like uncharacterized protein
MSIEDQLRRALRAGPESLPTEAAWERITQRASRRPKPWRRAILGLVPLLALGGVGGLELSGALAPGGHPTDVSVVPAPGPSPLESWHVADLPGWQHGFPGNLQAFPPPETLTCAGNGAGTCYVALQAYGAGPGGQRSEQAQTASRMFSSTDRGHSWAEVALPARTWITSPISCPGAKACILGAILDADPNSGPGESGRPVILSSSDSGRKWTTRELPEGVGEVDDLACTGSSHCVALTWSDTTTTIDGMEPFSGSDRYLPTTVFTTSDGGRTWRKAVLPQEPAGFYDSLSSLSCPSALRCDAVDYRAQLVAANGAYEVAAGSEDLLLTSADGGHSWRRAEQSSRLSPVALACPHASYCLSIAQSGSPTSSSPAPGDALVSRDGGATWTVVDRDVSNALAGLPLSIACSSPASCLATAGGTQDLSASTDGGHHWHPVTSLPASPGGIGSSFVTAASCFKTGPCLVLEDLSAPPTNRDSSFEAVEVVVDGP